MAQFCQVGRSSSLTGVIFVLLECPCQKGKVVQELFPQEHQTYDLSDWPKVLFRPKVAKYFIFNLIIFCVTHGSFSFYHSLFHNCDTIRNSMQDIAKGDDLQ